MVCKYLPSSDKDSIEGIHPDDDLLKKIKLK
jgi:hypothetical protein